MINRLKDVFASLKNHEVKYVVIGGIASMLHGVPRARFDLDVLIEVSAQNVTALLKAFEEAGLATATMVTSDEVLQNEITIFKDRVRIDVQTSTPGHGKTIFNDCSPTKNHLNHIQPNPEDGPRYLTTTIHNQCCHWVCKKP